MLLALILSFLKLTKRPIPNQSSHHKKDEPELIFYCNCFSISCLTFISYFQPEDRPGAYFLETRLDLLHNLAFKKSPQREYLVLKFHHSLYLNDSATLLIYLTPIPLSLKVWDKFFQDAQ